MVNNSRSCLYILCAPPIKTTFKRKERGVGGGCNGQSPERRTHIYLFWAVYCLGIFPGPNSDGFFKELRDEEWLQPFYQQLQKPTEDETKKNCMLKVNECEPRKLCPAKVNIWRRNKDNSTQTQTKASLDNQERIVEILNWIFYKEEEQYVLLCLFP